MIITAIGTPAMLEQLAEECTELAHAALKMSRVLRGENPTPKTWTECLDALTEEIADVELCMDQLEDFVDTFRIETIKDQKWARWMSRLKVTDGYTSRAKVTHLSDNKERSGQVPVPRNGHEE